MSSLGGMSGRYELKNWTRRSGCGYGSGARSTPRTTLKMAVLAPMASAIVRTTVREKDLARRRVRALMRIWRSMGPPSEQDRGHLLPSEGRRPERTEARLRVRSWDFPSRDRSQPPFRWCYNSQGRFAPCSLGGPDEARFRRDPGRARSRIAVLRALEAPATRRQPRAGLARIQEGAQRAE